MPTVYPSESCHRDRPEQHLRGQVAWTGGVDRWRFSTLLAGAIRNTFVVRY